MLGHRHRGFTAEVVVAVVGVVVAGSGSGGGHHCRVIVSVGG